MSTLLALSVRLHTAMLVAIATLVSRTGDPRDRRRDERGDVPGWVMVTVMSVGLVGAISAIARPELSQMVKSALDQVK